MQARPEFHRPRALLRVLCRTQGCRTVATTLTSLLLLPAAFNGKANATPPATAAATPAAPVVTAVPLAFSVTKLKNGLKVITLEDHHSPVVTLQVWYRVGSKDETVGRFGFAHLFEHLMFKGSKNVPNGAHTHYIEQMGGHFNADTSFDRTRFFETVQSNVLERVIFLEADRMASLVVDQANLDSERHVVEEELRVRVSNVAYGGVRDLVQSVVYPAGHPYAHMPIGSIPDLDAATLAEVRAFHETFYKPDNATLVLVGDFKTPTALAYIEKYFGPIPPRGKPFPRQPIPLTPPPTNLSMSLPDPLAVLPFVTIAFPVPGAANADTPVLRVLATIIGEKYESGLGRSLMGGERVSNGASASENALRFGGYFGVSADVLPGADRKDVTNDLNAEIQHLRYRPVSEKELEKAKARALTSALFGRLETDRVATLLGNSDILYGTPDNANKSYNQISAVSAADIQRVVVQYLLPEKGSVLYIEPLTSKKGDSN